MSDFAFTIGEPDAVEKTVPVTFTIAGEAYSRPVNADYGDSGTYSATGTLLRVLDVGRGVINQVTLGTLKSDDVIAAEIAEKQAEAASAPEPASGAGGTPEATTGA